MRPLGLWFDDLRGLAVRWLDLRPLLAAVGVGLASVGLGLAPLDGLLLAAVVLVLGVVWVCLDVGDEHPWPEVDVEETDGTRRDVAALTWTFLGRDGRVTEAAVRRLREVAARRLARHGVRLVGVTGRAGSAWAPDPVQDARARELLGDRAWATLAAHGGVMPSVGDIAHCVDVLDGLAAPTPGPLSGRRPGVGPAPTSTADERSHP